MTFESVGAKPVQQRARETRERILGAAIACLVKYGYAQTTIQRVLLEAAVSRGSLLHQFPSRDRLLVVAVQRLAEEHTTNLVAIGPRTPGESVFEAVDVGVTSLWETMHTPLFTASLELWIAARTSAELRAVLEPEEINLGRIIRGTLADLFGPELANRPGFAALQSLLLSSMRGVALTYTFAPDRDPSQDPHVELWKSLAHEYLHTSDDAR